jgi:hypothetical protein
VIEKPADAFRRFGAVLPGRLPIGPISVTPGTNHLLVSDSIRSNELQVLSLNTLSACLEARDLKKR